MQHLHMLQYVARLGQECKSELIKGAGLERVRWTARYCRGFEFDDWCSETRVGIKEKMVLEIPSENQAMSRQKKHGWACSLFQTWDAVDEKDFEVTIDVFLNAPDMVIEEEDRSDLSSTGSTFYAWCDWYHLTTNDY